jgi:hypothetical protein
LSFNAAADGFVCDEKEHLVYVFASRSFRFAVFYRSLAFTVGWLTSNNEVAAVAFPVVILKLYAVKGNIGLAGRFNVES